MLTSNRSQIIVLLVRLLLRSLPSFHLLSTYLLSLQEAALSDGKTAPCIVWSVCLLWPYRRHAHTLYTVNDHQRGVQYDPINSRGPPSATESTSIQLCVRYRKGSMLLYSQPSDACKHHLHVFISSCPCSATYLDSLRPESMQQLKTCFLMFLCPTSSIWPTNISAPALIYSTSYISTLNPVLEVVLDLLVLHISNGNVLLTALQRGQTKTLNHASL